MYDKSTAFTDKEFVLKKKKKGAVTNIMVITFTQTKMAFNRI